MIAQSRLKPETMAAIRKLVGKHIDLDWIASCADVFDHSEGHIVCAGAITVDGDAAATKPWHFINVPITDHPDASSLANYCKGGAACVTAQIREDMRVLEDPSAATHDKQVALMYLVHFVGDAHQPLHCADDRDEGGNLKSTNVVLKGTKTMNLHQIWDHAIDNPGEEDETLLFKDVTAEARELAGEASQVVKARSSVPGELASWTEGDDLPEHIALESFQIAQDQIYPQYAKDHGQIADAADPHKIGASYHDRMRPIAHERIAMAGVRLAFLLEQAFSNAGAASTTRVLKPSNIRLDLKDYGSQPFGR